MDSLSKSSNELKPLRENPASRFLFAWAGLRHDAAFDWIKLFGLIHRVEQSYVSHAVGVLNEGSVCLKVHCINGLLVQVYFSCNALLHTEVIRSTVLDCISLIINQQNLKNDFIYRFIYL